MSNYTLVFLISANYTIFNIRFIKLCLGVYEPTSTTLTATTAYTRNPIGLGIGVATPVFTDQPPMYYQNDAYYQFSSQTFAVKHNSAFLKIPELTCSVSGATPITYSLSPYGGGTVPTWASIDSNTGFLQGTIPELVGNQTFQFYIESASTKFSSNSQKLITLEVEAPKCNDGEITPNEQWEDGNISDGDGCSTSCQIEPGWNCVNNPALTSSTCAPICGDGLIKGSEKWDDGNIIDNQGCLYDCSGSIDGWHWTGGSSTQKDTWQEHCNDGFITLNEQWEDGNLKDGDGCSTSCQIEPGWNCVNNPALTSSTCTPICGDGLVKGSEKWDDGNKIDNQGCLPDCSGSIDGWHWTGGSSTQKDTWQEQCNDGFITLNEHWEDGNLKEGDGCSASCKIEPGWSCVNNPALTSSTCTPICGDGLVAGSEKWDDGNVIDNQGCLPDCSGSIDGWHWTGGSSTQKDTWQEQCNDGFITLNELWEDGNLKEGDGCSASCKIEPGWSCVNNTALTSSTCTPICGDGLIKGSEKWDDGNVIDNQGCLPDCSGSIDGWHWTGGSSTQKDTWQEQCNDGFITLNEQWEDGNLKDGDGWSPTCQIESGWNCVNNTALTSSTCTPICGDGLIKGSEKWDDGNKITNQWCSPDCSGPIYGWYCNKTTGIAPYKCETHLMDGIHIKETEDWDDGNDVDLGDGWTNSGKIEEHWICEDDLTLMSKCKNMLIIIEEINDKAVIVVGTSVAVGVGASSFSPTSAGTVWALINVLQMMTILMGIRIYIPQAIRNYIGAYSWVLLNFSFMKFQELAVIGLPAQKLDSDQPSNLQENVGLDYRSSFANAYLLLWIFLFLSGMHLLTKLVGKCCTTRYRWMGKIKVASDWLSNQIKSTYYLRLLLEMFILLLLASMSEIYLLDTSSAPSGISLFIAFCIFLFCIIMIGVALIYSQIYKESNHEHLKEFYSLYRDEPRYRVCSPIELWRRFLIIWVVIFLNRFNRDFCFILIYTFQCLYTLFIILRRPYKNLKDSVVEIINQVFYIVLICFLWIFRNEEQWTKVRVHAFVWTLSANTFMLTLLNFGKEIYNYEPCNWRKF